MTNLYNLIMTYVLWQEGDQFQFTHLLIGKDILMKWHNYSLLNVLQSLMDKALKRYHKLACSRYLKMR